MESQKQSDGISSLLPREKMILPARKWRDAYDIVPGAPLVQREFGYYCLDEWYQQGLDPQADKAEVFQYDQPDGRYIIGGLGGCEAAFYPNFEDKLIEDRGEHEVIQDFSGRHVLVFKGRRDGFMPEYLDHPVKDMKSWEEKCKWRMNPETPGRYDYLERVQPEAIVAAGQGVYICQLLVGGYMYLRSLMGPIETLYAFYDMPEVIHDCMKTWLELADAVTSRHQEFITFDELFLSEDICYNHGLLCSPDHVKEFLFPYYQQLITNVKSRQIDRNRRLFINIDTDGNCVWAIDLYQEGIGMDALAPFEVASGCDVVEIGKRYPNLVMSGGIDKRILAKGKKEIDEMLERILPAMRKRGGYIPTCDHGVPAEVSMENYLYYRKRSLELGN